MNNFTVMAQGLDVSELKDALDGCILFGENHQQMTPTGHREIKEIWIHAPDPTTVKNYANYGTSPQYWHKGFYDLPQVKQIIYTMMALGDASGIERCFISMIPPKCKVLKHRDANVVDDGCVRFHCSINSAPGIVFYCGETDQEEVMTPDNGDIYYFRNDLPHWIENNSDQVRYSLYADLKCDWSKQYKGGDDDNE